MFIRKEIQNIILPIIKGLPITLLLIILSIVAANRLLRYTVPSYQANGSIKVDDRDFGISKFYLFDPDAAKSNYNVNYFLTEVEVFKSKKLIRAALETLDFDIVYHRVGDLKLAEIYDDSPIKISYDTIANKQQNKPLFLKYIKDDLFLLGSNKDNFLDTIRSETKYSNENITFTLHLQKDFIAKKSQVLKSGDIFSFTIYSMDKLVNTINSSNLFVKPIDKEIAIVKIYYQHEVPKKSQLFVDALMKAYINGHKMERDQQANKTLNFVDNQLQKVTQDLKAADGKYALYKNQNEVVNIEQQIASKLREISQLNLQKVNLNVQEAELKQIYKYITSGNSLQSFSPNFEALQDPFFKDNYLKIQAYELEKQDLLLKYTDVNEKVINIISKINDLRTYLNESVKNALNSIDTKKSDVDIALNNIEEKIETYPTKESKLVMLEREVKLNEGMYNVLVEQRTELDISKSSQHSFHQIIDYPNVPETPISPNKPLLYAVSLFFALLLGLILSFLMYYLQSTINSKSMLENTLSIPILGIINKVSKKQEKTTKALANLYVNLKVLQKNKPENKGYVITISSLLPSEGKTFTSVNFAKTMGSIGQKVLIIDMDIRKPSVHQNFDMKNEYGLSSIIQKEKLPQEAIVKSGFENLDILVAGNIKEIFSGLIFSHESMLFLNELKNKYDFIIIDTPPVGLLVDSVPIMHESDVNLFVVRAKRSKIRHTKNIEPLLNEYQIPNVYMVLNDLKENRKAKYSYYYYKNYSDDRPKLKTANV